VGGEGLFVYAPDGSRAPLALPAGCAMSAPGVDPAWRWQVLRRGEEIGLAPWGGAVAVVGDDGSEARRSDD